MPVQSTIQAAILPRLEGVIDRGQGRYYARCPAHEDRSPSLSIDTGDDGRILLYCFAGCPTEAILAALGLGWADLYPDPWQAAQRAATARQRPKPPEPDPLLLDRLVLQIAAAEVRAGKTLTVEDWARVQLARLRLAALEGVAA